MARKDFRQPRKQYEEKNPMAAFWERTARQYERQALKATSPGLRIYAARRAEFCRANSAEAEIFA